MTKSGAGTARLYHSEGKARSAMHELSAESRSGLSESFRASIRPLFRKLIDEENRFTEEPIAFILKRVEAGKAIVEVRRKMVVSEQAFYLWMPAR